VEIKGFIFLSFLTQKLGFCLCFKACVAFKVLKAKTQSQMQEV
jgi:hypothetical protein